MEKLNINKEKEEEEMINRNIEIIKDVIKDEEAGKSERLEALNSMHIIQYYIGGLKSISKKFEKEWQKAKEQEAKQQDEETDEDVEYYNAQKLISETCDEIKNMLLEKNRKYGNSALSPKRIFSKANPIEQINIRIDDKLSRIESAQSDDMEDSPLDLLGYLILRRVAEKINRKETR